MKGKKYLEELLSNEFVIEEYRNEINEYVERLEQQCKKQKEVIDKAIKYIECHKYTIKHYEPYGTPTGLPNYETYNIKGYYKLLDILKDKEVNNANITNKKEMV